MRSAPSAPSALRGDRIARAGRELQAIVAGTEQATQTILQAAEEIDRSRRHAGRALKSEHDQGLAHDIQDRVVQIFEACNFQDLTGQRVAKVVATLQVRRGSRRRGCMADLAAASSNSSRSCFDDDDAARSPATSTARSCRTIPAIPRRTTSTRCSAAPERVRHRVDVSAGRRIAAKQASATTAKPAANASAVASDARSATKAITSGAADCITSQGPLMRPISRP